MSNCWFNFLPTCLWWSWPNCTPRHYCHSPHTVIINEFIKISLKMTIFLRCDIFLAEPTYYCMTPSAYHFVTTVLTLYRSSAFYTSRKTTIVLWQNVKTDIYWNTCSKWMPLRFTSDTNLCLTITAHCLIFATTRFLNKGLTLIIWT